MSATTKGNYLRRNESYDNRRRGSHAVPPAVSDGSFQG
jgi:hypothetical protein